MMLSGSLRERIRQSSALRIRRKLNGPGSIIVSVGQVVEPEDVLGRYELSGGFTKVNIARLLNVSTKDGGKFLQRKIGEKIFKGELLGYKKTLFSKKVLLAPTDGVLEHYDPSSGELKLKYLPRKLQLMSGVYGIVEQKNPDNEIIIKTQATEIFGLYGSGKQREGVLSLCNDKGNLVKKNLITRDLKARILVTGALIYKDAIHTAINFGVAGIITGGMSGADFISMVGSIDQLSGNETYAKVGTDIGISIVGTEGFGPIPLGDDIYGLLSRYAGKYVFINGNIAKLTVPSSDPDTIIRLRTIELPPILKDPPRPPEVRVKELELGSTIRIVWPPYAGAQGKIIAIDKMPTQLPSGIVTYLLTVETTVRKIKVPYPNVEIIP